MARYYEEVTEPWYKPKYWRKRTWAIVVASIVAVVVIVIVVPVVVTKKEKYPDYSRLNYTLTDSCKWQPVAVLESPRADSFQTRANHSLTSSTISMIMIQVWMGLFPGESLPFAEPNTDCRRSPRICPLRASGNGDEDGM